MIRIAFLLNFPLTYKGGINYLKNLFYAVGKASQGEIEIVLFVPKNIKTEYIDIFSPYALIVETSILERKSLQWFLDKVSERLFSTNILLSRVLKKNKIDVISHSNYLDNSGAFKVVNWIPDFQSLHYPHLWTNTALKNNHKLYNKLIEKSNRIILSSNNAFDDYKVFSKEGHEKAVVLQFVSQPNEDLTPKEVENIFNHIKSSYQIKPKFLYMPNQFWQHKNHIVVFKAIKLLKDQGFDLQVVTTGQMSDYRVGEDHINMLKKFISDNKLEDNILLLGLIPYKDVLVMMQCCIGLINPSLFEGWSSTVEEAKSIGKNVILSDIPVHREQNPEFGFYFNHDNEIQLASLLLEIWQKNSADEIVTLDKNKLLDRTVAFGQNYINIITDLVGTTEK